VQIEKLRHCRVQFANGPVDLEQAAQRCDLAVTNATHGTGVAMLLAGKPLVHLPMYLEQSLFASATERLGASVTVGVKNGRAILQAIEHVLNSPRYTQAAAAFAERYRSTGLDHLMVKLTDNLEELLSSASQ